jgi:hypothetical protein
VPFPPEIAIKEVFGPAEADAMEMAPQALGKLAFGDGNGAIGVGGRRIKELPDRSDEGTGFGAQWLKRRDCGQGLHGAGLRFDSGVFQVARI